MSNDETTSSALDALMKSTATGGGPKSSMPVDVWKEILDNGGVVQIATFHGVKGEQVGYRSGEIHNQLKQTLTGYFYCYRNVEGSDQPQLFLSLKKKVFTEAGIPKTAISQYKED